MSSPDFGTPGMREWIRKEECAYVTGRKARVKIDKQLRNAGWDIVARNEYLPNSTSAVKEALM